MKYWYNEETDEYEATAPDESLDRFKGADGWIQISQLEFDQAMHRLKD